MVSLERWFPTTARDPNEGRGGYEVGAREVFMESSIIMIKISKLVSELKKNDRKNLNPESVLIILKHTVARKGISIKSFTVNATGYCYFHGRVMDHIPSATSGSNV